MTNSKLGWRPWMWFITTADRNKPIPIEEAIRLAELKAAVEDEDVNELKRLRLEGATTVQQ